MHKKRRVVVTGLGIIAPNGVGKEAFWQGLVSGKNCVVRITRFDAANFYSQMAGEIHNFNPAGYIEKEKLPFIDRSFQFALVAAKLAINDAKLKIEEENREKIGTFVGLGVGGVNIAEPQFNLYAAKGPESISPYLYLSWLPSACSGYISLEFKLKGQSNVISTGCTSATDAIGLGYWTIRDNLQDIILAGGTEAPLTPGTFNSFCSLRALSHRNNAPEIASRPFDKERDGFILAEGAGIIILEELEHALKRKVPIYGEIVGYGASSTAYHMTALDPNGEESARAMKESLQAGKIKKEQIGYLCAHGSSTPLNGKMETIAIKKVFGKYAYKIPISSIKSMLGHPPGAAGVMQTITCLLVMEKNFIPPTINYQYPDSDCDLDYVPNCARSAQVEVTLINTSGFAGRCAALTIKRYLN